MSMTLSSISFVSSFALQVLEEEEEENDDDDEQQHQEEEEEEDDIQVLASNLITRQARHQEDAIEEGAAGDDNELDLEQSSSQDDEEEWWNDRRSRSRRAIERQRHRLRRRLRKEKDFQNLDSSLLLNSAGPSSRTIDAPAGVSLPEDVNVEEQRMLLAALLGEPYDGTLPDFSKNTYAPPKGLSVSARERLSLLKEQDTEYYESLVADQERERREREAAEAEASAKIEAEIREREEQEFLKAEMEAKTKRLAPEPDENEKEGVVSLMVRLPRGGRLHRRFRCTAPLDDVFDWIDVNIYDRGDSDVKPGNYSLVSQFPRREFGNDRSGATLASLNLAHTQEALFVVIKD